MIALSASLQNCPPNSATAGRKFAFSSSRSSGGRPAARPTRKSSSPYAGAMWTMPVPSSVVTKGSTCVRKAPAIFAFSSVGNSGSYDQPASSRPAKRATTS